MHTLEVDTPSLVRSAKRPIVHDEALITWVGDGLPHQLRPILERFVPDAPIEILVGPGWWPLLVRLNARLSAMAPDYAIRYVRAQDGQLQFEVGPRSIEHTPDRFMDTIRDAEAESRRTCEMCGRQGQVRSHGDEPRTVLCDEDAGFDSSEPSAQSRRSLP